MVCKSWCSNFWVVWLLNVWRISQTRPCYEVSCQLMFFPAALSWCLLSNCVLICEQWLCVPFLLLNKTSVNIAETAFNHTFQEPWVGSVDKDSVWKWIDDFLMLVSWSVYFISLKYGFYFINCHNFEKFLWSVLGPIVKGFRPFSAWLIEGYSAADFCNSVRYWTPPSPSLLEPYVS